MMRVLQVVAGLDIGGVFGGAERFGLELAMALDRSAFEVEVCAYWRSDTQAEAHWRATLASSGIPLTFASDRPPSREPGAVWSGASAIVARCRARRYDLVHAHHEGGALAALMARAAGGARRAIRTIQVPLQREWGGGAGAALLRAAFSRGLFPLALDAEIVVSDDHAERLRRRAAARLAKRRPVVIPSCISGEVMRASGEPRRAREAARVVIGSTGRLTEQKGYAWLVDAAARVAGRAPQARFVIHGEGELRGALRARANGLGLGESFSLPGQRADVAGALREMDVFVLPSLWEGLPLALLDAMAMGVPCVATDVAGNADLLQGGAGWLAPPRDGGALADAILEAIEHPGEAAARAAVARDRALGAYSPQAIAARHAALYRALAADGGR